MSMYYLISNLEGASNVKCCDLNDLESFIKMIIARSPVHQDITLYELKGKTISLYRYPFIAGYSLNKVNYFCSGARGFYKNRYLVEQVEEGNPKKEQWEDYLEALPCN